jgi:Asp-tRNA(Asn)/Glu-tRNA(Gln) amidotransferase A subunit family amidase
MVIQSPFALTAIEVAAAIRDRELSCLEYVNGLLDRIEASAPLGAFVAIDHEGIRSAAAAVDRSLAEGQTGGPLAGVPLAIKDNIEVAGLPAAAGTPTLARNRPRDDADLIARLRTAGALVLGKTNMHELAGGITTDNAYFGRALNPYDRHRVPGGSSGGTAIAVAARLVPGGIGTDTGGSNRIPAAWCGVVCFRPTTGRWPNTGLIPNSPTRDTAGPMARSVADCALIDAVITLESVLPPALLTQLRLGVPRSTLWRSLDPRVEVVAEAVLEALRKVGIELIDVELPDLSALSGACGVPIAMYEHPHALNTYLANTALGVDATAVMAGIASPDVKALLSAGHKSFSEEDYRRALFVTRPTLQAVYRDAFARHGVQALVFPTSPILPPPHGAERIEHLGEKLSTLWLAIRNTDPGSIAGIPGISLPAGLIEGLPFGIALDGPEASDRVLLSVAAAIEPLLPNTPPPAQNWPI